MGKQLCERGLRTRLLDVENDILENLREMSVHPMRNPTTGVPMGHISPTQMNHIYRMCCDILHTFECGLMKNVTLWILTIIKKLSGMPGHGFQSSNARLDARIASFKDLPKCLNVTNSYFKKGITSISASKSKKQDAQSTGGAAGFRSCEFVPLLIQIYLTRTLSMLLLIFKLGT